MIFKKLRKKEKHIFNKTFFVSCNSKLYYSCNHKLIITNSFPHLEGCSIAVLLSVVMGSSTWLMEWGPSGGPWIISAEASWLGLAGALMMWYHSEPGLSVFVPECGCACLWVCVCMSVRVYARWCVHSSTHAHWWVCPYSIVGVCVCVFAPVCSLQPVDLSHFARAGGTGGCQAAPGAWVQYG